MFAHPHSPTLPQVPFHVMAAVCGVPDWPTPVTDDAAPLMRSAACAMGTVAVSA